jgi:5-formyltetrahydrofolate cyclo-ligase
LQLSNDYRSKAAVDAAKHLISQSLFQQSEHIACYMPYRAELSPEPLIHHIWQANKKCYLPRLTSEKSLEFMLYQENDALEPNQFGILEPLASAEKIAVEQLDLVVVPLVAFDLFGHRLGTGGGYYDRTFAFKKLASDEKPSLFGFAYAVQQADRLPVDEWDVMLQGVVTEKEFFHIK